MNEKDDDDEYTCEAWHVYHAACPQVPEWAVCEALCNLVTCQKIRKA